MGEAYQAGEVCKLTGADYRNLDYWARVGAVVPSIRKAQGKGWDRFYSFGDVVAVAAVETVRAAGFHLQAALPVVRYLQAREYLAGAPATWVVWGGGQVRELTDAEFAAGLSVVPTALRLVLDLGALVRGVRERAALTGPRSA